MRFYLDINIKVTKWTFRGPASPRPREHKRELSFIPAGILTFTESLPLYRPCPLQLVHGFSIITPEPSQVGQVLRILIKPWFDATWPTPPQGMTHRLCRFIR